MLASLHRRGVRLWLAADRVHFDGPADALDDETLRACRAVRDDLRDLLEQIEERAAIVEFDAGLSRHDAEAAAWGVFLDPAPLVRNGSGSDMTRQMHGKSLNANDFPEPGGLVRFSGGTQRLIQKPFQKNAVCHPSDDETQCFHGEHAVSVDAQRDTTQRVTKGAA